MLTITSHDTPGPPGPKAARCRLDASQQHWRQLLSSADAAKATATPTTTRQGEAAPALELWAPREGVGWWDDGVEPHNILCIYIYIHIYIYNCYTCAYTHVCVLIMSERKSWMTGFKTWVTGFHHLMTGCKNWMTGSVSPCVNTCETHFWKIRDGIWKGKIWDMM